MNATAGLSWRGWDNSQIGWDVISLETEQMCSDEVLAQADAFSQARNTGCFKKIMQGYYTALENNTVCSFWHSFKLDNCMIDQPVEEQPYQTYWVHPDHLGSGSVITNQAGNTTNWYEYMPFGEMLMEQSNYEYNNPYKYNGKELDEATGCTITEQGITIQRRVCGYLWIRWRKKMPSWSPYCCAFNALSTHIKAILWFRLQLVLKPEPL